MSEVKVVKTSINQVVEVELPEGYVLNTNKPKIDLNDFLGTISIYVVKVEPTLTETS